MRGGQLRNECIHRGNSYVLGGSDYGQMLVKDNKVLITHVSSGDLMHNNVSTANNKKLSNCSFGWDGNSIGVVKFWMYFEGNSQEDLLMKWT